MSIVETVVHVFCFLLSKSSHRLGQNGQGNSTLRAGIHSEFSSRGGGAKQQLIAGEDYSCTLVLLRTHLCKHASVEPQGDLA